ncbi:MAG: L-rhamnose/proton symporter RhaT [Rikenellaceae bacterium]
MNAILGLIIIAIGSFCQSSSYVPIQKVKNWSWESFWLTQGVFAWLVFPFLGTLLVAAQGVPLSELLIDKDNLMVVVYGALWGIGGLTFGLSMRYLGVALGQSIALGTCSAFGTLLPAIFAGDDLFSGGGLILLIGVSITLLGIAVIGYAGALRSRNMSEEEKRKAIKDFALTKGLLVALLAGVMSGCFALGLDAGTPIKESAINAGVAPIFAGLPVIFLVTFGGFISNLIYCVYGNIKRKEKIAYILPQKQFVQNMLFSALAGVLWYSQFFGLEIGKSLLVDSPILLAFSWSILMTLNVLFSNFWGVVLKEWKGSGKTTMRVLIIGILVLILSIFFPSLF